MYGLRIDRQQGQPAHSRVLEAIIPVNDANVLTYTQANGRLSEEGRAAEIKNTASIKEAFMNEALFTLVLFYRRPI